MVTPRPALDLLSTPEIVTLLLQAEQRVVPAVHEQASTIGRAAELVAHRLAAGGRLLFTGAGTSGRLALAEAAELPGTFGLSPTLVLGRAADASDGDEDDLQLAEHDAADLALTATDTLVAVAASGRTPYTLALARAARAAGAAVVCVVNVCGSELATLADVTIEVEVGPEVLRGSSRLTAGTAQKIALNVLTTAAMVRFGRVHGDLMVDVVGANAKLRERAAGIVAEIAGCAHDDAVHALLACDGNARAAVLHLTLGVEPEQAAARARAHRSLRDALG